MPRVRGGAQKIPRGGMVLELVWQAALDDYIVDLAWSSNGTVLAAAAVSGGMGAWRAHGERCFLTSQAHRLGIMAIAWQPDAAVLATAGQDGTIRLWDGWGGTMLRELPGGAAWVSHVCWCPTGSIHQTGSRPRLASAAGRSVKIWNAAGELELEYGDFTSTIADLKWHAGRGELAIAAYGGLTLCNPDSPARRRLLSWQGSPLVLAWSPDGRYVASGDQDATVHFWIASSGKDLQMWGYPTKVRELAWDATSRYLATGGGPAITVWDCSGDGPEGTKPIQLTGSDAAVTALAYQGRAELLAAAMEDGLIALWAPARLRRPLTRLALGSAVTKLAWSPDDRLLAVASEDGSVGVYGVPA